MNGVDRIRGQIRKCDALHRKNAEYYQRSGKRSYYRKARKYYICAREMEAILRLAQSSDGKGVRHD
jgi:DNA replicative helicase MCM subunit Mcm2 (Cdc46/Mcm family)